MTLEVVEAMLHREDVVDLTDFKPTEHPTAHQKEWQRVFLNRSYPGMTRVEFNADEERMIREMAHKIGYPKEDVVRMSVRDMYVWRCGGR